MSFDPQKVLTEYSDAYNARDPERLRSLFALEDARFSVFEDFSGELFDGETYGVILESVFEATGEMSFELLRCDRFGEFAVIHAVQRIEDSSGEDEVLLEARLRGTLLVSLAGEAPRIISAHFSAMPPSAGECCSTGGCCGG